MSRISIAAAKAKGRRAANEVKTMIHAIFPELQDEDVIRTSGGVSGEDMVLSPVARAMLPISIEAKNQEKLNIWSALQQADDNCGGHMPVLIFRRNHSKLYAALEAEDLFTILRMAYEYRIRNASNTGDAKPNGLSN